MIKDSGDRTAFNTGAVRDMHKGKGRFDLLPWEAIHLLAVHSENGAEKYGEHNVDKGIPQHSLIDSAIRHIKRYLCGDTDEPHLCAAAWNIMWALQQTKTQPDLLDVPYIPETTARSQHAWLETLLIDGYERKPCLCCAHVGSASIDAPCRLCCYRHVDALREGRSLFAPNWAAIKHVISTRTLNTDNLE